MVLATLAAMLAGLLATATPAEASGPSVFVNEIHYRNNGTDVGEGVEIAGPAGTDLTGWSVVFYDGANGLRYGTLPLAGTLPDQQNGFGTLAFFPIFALQDGLDGLALVDASSSVVQFLSYEPGTFVANNGPASGMTSQSLIANQPESTPAGHSLQLGVPFGQISGTTYDDFGWDTAKPNTFGDVNGLQNFGTSATDQKGHVRDDLVALLGTGSAEDDEELEKAIERIDQSLDPALWADATTPDPVEGKKIFDRERHAVIALGKVVGPAAAATAAAEALTDIDRELAAAAIDAADSGGGDADLIAAAQVNLASGDSYAASGQFAKAIEHYRKAWQDAIAATG